MIGIRPPQFPGAEILNFVPPLTPAVGPGQNKGESGGPVGIGLRIVGVYCPW